MDMRTPPLYVYYSTLSLSVFIFFYRYMWSSDDWVEFTDLYELKDIDWNLIEDIDNEQIYYIWDSKPFLPERH